MKDDPNRARPDPLPEPRITEPLLELTMSLVMLGPAEAANEELEPGPGSKGPPEDRLDGQI